MLAFLAAILALYAFGEHSLFTLIGLTLGSVAMVLAYLSEYRAGCVLAMLVVVIAAASASPLMTVTELGSLMNAVLGLFLPVLAVIWFALVTGSEEAYWYGQRLGPVLQAAAFVLLCVFSVPITVAVIGIMSPNISVRFSEFEEISIILLFEAVGAAALSFREVRPPSA
ncbi:MAG: hypothetical protein A3K67_05100 [Euryarchaeota archaeon RBG_16_62_10]|nr:MAG: hypothetical protein A3K67_05100 [Euryarchaeota archaeon RBG_16_62_10]